MKVIKKVGVLSSGKIVGILYALMGLVIGAIITLVSLVGLAVSPGGAGMFGALFGIGSIILLPLFYGGMGFVSGILMALFYNLISNWIGGLEIEIK